MRPTDEELVFQCRDGDTDAYALLVARYQHAVYATAFHYAGRYGGAEDIAQEAFWAAYRSLPRLREPEQFGSWLKAITTRVSANWLRKNAPRLRNETPLPRRRAHYNTLNFNTEAKSSSVSDDVYELVHRAIESLPERYQLPVVLRYVQEMSYEEISHSTGDSQDEIRGILSRAAGMLRKELQHYKDIETDQLKEEEKA